MSKSQKRRMSVKPPIKAVKFKIKYERERGRYVVRKNGTTREKLRKIEDIHQIRVKSREKIIM